MVKIDNTVNIEKSDVFDRLTADDCVKHIGFKKLLKEMDEWEVLENLSRDTIIKFIEECGFKTTVQMEPISLLNPKICEWMDEDLFIHGC